MNPTDNYRTQLQNQGVIEYALDSDNDIAEISDELAELMAEFEAQHGRPLSKRDIMWWQGFHQPPRETTMDTANHLNQEATTSIDGAEHAAYIDAISAAVASGADTGYDTARFEGGAVSNLVDDTLRETAYDTRPVPVQDYEAATNEQSTGAFARFAEMAVPIQTVEERAREAAENSAKIKLMMKEIQMGRGYYEGKVPAEVGNLKERLHEL